MTSTLDSSDASFLTLEDPEGPMPGLWSGVVLVVCLALALGLPNLGRHELESEEARRLLPATELIENGDLVVPRIWQRPYLAKPPLFYWFTALVGRAEGALATEPGRAHLETSANYARAQREVLYQRYLDHLPPIERHTYHKRILRAEMASLGLTPGDTSERRAALRELATATAGSPRPELPALQPVSPLATRWAALLASALTAIALVVVGRTFAPGAGLIAGCLYLAAPAVLGKSTLGEIETTFALLTFGGTALAWFGLERRSTVLALAGGTLLGLAALTKGPFAILFSLPALAIWAWTHGTRRAALARVGLVALAAALPFLVWAAALAEATSGGEELWRYWRAEAGRGGTGGLAQFLTDRWRLIAGVFLGWLPASLVVIGAQRSSTSRAWREQPLVRFSELVLVVGLVVLAVWPGVRARYALPLAPWIALLGGTVLVAATRSGDALPWRSYADRAARMIGMFLLWLAPLVALVLTLAWLAGPDAIVPGAALGLGHVLFAWALVVGARLLIAGGDARPASRWLLVAVLVALGLRTLERTAVEAGRTDREERAAGALWLEDAIDRAGGGEVAIEHWGHFNLLAYTGERFRWIDDPDGLLPGALLVSGNVEGRERAQSADWKLLFPPERGLGEEAWRSIGDLRALVLLQRQ
ncbi:MAG: hypothetical protein WD226_12505 [Planctomycetota bacterium]